MDKLTIEPTSATSEERWIIVADSAKAAPAEKSTARVLGGLVCLIRARRQLVAALLVGLLVGVVAALAWPGRYTATSRILPPAEAKSSASAMMGQLGELAALAGRDLGLKNPNLIYIAMLRSDSVLDALIAKHDLKGVYGTDRQSRLRKMLAAASAIELTKEGTIEIAVTDRDPGRAAGLANSFVEELGRLNSRLVVTEAARRRSFFEEQLRTVREELARAEVELREVQEHTGLLQLDAQAKATIETVARARGELAAREAQLERVRSFSAPGNPALVRAEREVGALRANVRRMEGSSGGESGDMSVARLPKAGVEYVRRYREVKYREAVYEFMVKQLEAAKVDEAGSSGAIQVLDPAKPPDTQSSPIRPLIVIFFGIAGLALGALRSLWKDGLLFTVPVEVAESLALARKHW
jgi:tyrosine-protein kinase Etk/Wzc